MSTKAEQVREQPVMSKSMAKRIAAQREQEPTAAEWRRAIERWLDLPTSLDDTPLATDDVLTWIEALARDIVMERKA